MTSKRARTVNISEDLEKVRCSWCGSDPIYVAYHDNEWGRPLHGDNLLFEMLSLEGQQAGLSWITVLKRREGYRQAFEGFDIAKVAAYTTKDVDRILNDKGVIRHRGKLESIVSNAGKVLDLRKDLDKTFDEFVWSFAPAAKSTAPEEKIVKEAMDFSIALKARGFRFTGPTICHAFFQAVGMLNDHSESCFLQSESAGSKE